MIIRAESRMIKYLNRNCRLLAQPPSWQFSTSHYDRTDATQGVYELPAMTSVMLLGHSHKSCLNTLHRCCIFDGAPDVPAKEAMPAFRLVTCVTPKLPLLPIYRLLVRIRQSDLHFQHGLCRLRFQRLNLAKRLPRLVTVPTLANATQRYPSHPCIIDQ